MRKRKRKRVSEEQLILLGKQEFHKEVRQALTELAKAEKKDKPYVVKSLAGGTILFVRG